MNCLLNIIQNLTLYVIKLNWSHFISRPVCRNEYFKWFYILKLWGQDWFADVVNFGTDLPFSCSFHPLSMLFVWNALQRIFLEGKNCFQSILYIFSLGNFSFLQLTIITKLFALTLQIFSYQGHSKADRNWIKVVVKLFVQSLGYSEFHKVKSVIFGIWHQ